MDSDLMLALRLARLAADMALPAAGHNVASWTKPDGSLATEMDIAVEQAMIGTLRGERPDDTILGEETGESGAASSTRRWLLDPIDGTSVFCRAGRDWGSHVALTENGRVIVAVMTRPTEGRCWWAAAGSGAYAGCLADPAGPAKALRVSGTSDVRQARIGGLVDEESALLAALPASAHWITDEVSILAALLEGQVDAVIDVGGDPWDLAPAALLVPEAGGCFRDPAGGSRLDLRWALYGNASLTAEIASLLCPDAAPGEEERSCQPS